MSDASGDWEGGSPWLFLLGLLVFLGSALLFLADLIRDVDVLRSLVANTVGAALLITWAAHDTLHDPNSEVATAGGAAGTALLLYGLYLLAAGVVIAVSSVFHDRLLLGLLYAAVAFAAGTIGFVIFPTEAVLEEEDAEDESGEGESDEGESDEGESDADTDGPTDSDADTDEASDTDSDGGHSDDATTAASTEGDEEGADRTTEGEGGGANGTAGVDSDDEGE